MIELPSTPNTASADLASAVCAYAPKIIEIDAWPSDCIAMATAQSAPIFVSPDVWDEVEDMTESLRKMQEEGSHTEERSEE